MKKLLLVPAFLGIVSLVVAAFISCADEVGTPCTVSTGTTDASASGALVNTHSLECRSRLCIYYPGSTESQPLCTRICEDDDDCPGRGEPDDSICSRGYKCVVAQTVGALKCCKMCVCENFLEKIDGGGAAATCANFTPNCPEL